VRLGYSHNAGHALGRELMENLANDCGPGFLRYMQHGVTQEEEVI
jgi:hypothetical protein